MILIKTKCKIFETLISSLKAVIYAPSACNRQAWKFIIIDEKDIKDLICKNFGSNIIENAPAGILVLYRNDVSFNYRLYKDHFQSAAAAIQNILLSAYESGLGTCWVCNLPSPKYLKKLLNIPKSYEVIAYMS